MKCTGKPVLQQTKHDTCKYKDKNNRRLWFRYWFFQVLTTLIVYLSSLVYVIDGLNRLMLGLDWLASESIIFGSEWGAPIWSMINWQWSIETDRLKHETPKHTTGKITRSIKLASTWNTSTRVRWLCWCIHKCIIGEECTIINVYYMKGNQLIDWNENGKQTWSWMQNVNVLFLLHTKWHAIDCSYWYDQFDMSTKLARSNQDDPQVIATNAQTRNRNGKTNIERKSTTRTCNTHTHTHTDMTK